MARDDLPAGLLAFDDQHTPLYTVGQVADLLGVQPAFVRRLDTERVITPSRSTGGQRRYTRAEVGRVQAVSDMAGEGMSLAGIRRILVLEGELDDLRAEVTGLRAQLAGD
jgi:DNA-binding transcriptional MerR regulator